MSDNPIMANYRATMRRDKEAKHKGVEEIVNRLFEKVFKAKVAELDALNAQIATKKQELADLADTGGAEPGKPKRQNRKPRNGGDDDADE